jgi:hypothetical protein
MKNVRLSTVLENDAIYLACLDFSGESGGIQIKRALLPLGSSHTRWETLNHE